MESRSQASASAGRRMYCPDRGSTTPLAVHQGIRMRFTPFAHTSIGPVAHTLNTEIRGQSKSGNVNGKSWEAERVPASTATSGTDPYGAWDSRCDAVEARNLDEQCRLRGSGSRNPEYAWTAPSPIGAFPFRDRHDLFVESLAWTLTHGGTMTGTFVSFPSETVDLRLSVQAREPRSSRVSNSRTTTKCGLSRWRQPNPGRIGSADRPTVWRNCGVDTWCSALVVPVS